ncbi:8752_t:CDS:2 [Cetraspora pellucida]|uniref:8752_t:CDS:1 n=1 Tax=Cetraspora pellucida TaxID=1433469 RepID=A0A9N8VIB1_9GLOM|nr:8752_t:CDS:2 [Cetraspora pellucida]
MNSFTVNTETKPTETVQYFPTVGEPVIGHTDGRFPQLSLDEQPGQAIENSPRLAVKEEENAQSVSSDDQKEHSPTPSASKTTYTCHVCAPMGTSRELGSVSQIQLNKASASSNDGG